MAVPEVLYQTGTHAARPAASSGCVLYSCTDHGLVYRSDGSAWTTFLTLPAGTDPLTTKGDLHGFGTASARIPVGTDGQVLTADSAQALGVKWATAGGGGAIASVHRVQATADVVENPHPTAATVVSGMTLTFSLAAAADCILIFQARFTKGVGNARMGFFDGGVQIAPVNAGGEQSFHGRHSDNVTETFEVHYRQLVNLASGSHTIDVRHSAVANTSMITWRDRLLTVEVLA